MPEKQAEEEKSEPLRIDAIEPKAEDAPEIPFYAPADIDLDIKRQQAGRATRFSQKDYLISLWNTCMEQYAAAHFIIELYGDMDENKVIKSVIDNRGGIGVERKIRVKDVLPNQIRKFIGQAEELIVVDNLIKAEEAKEKKK